MCDVGFLMYNLDTSYSTDHFNNNFVSALLIEITSGQFLYKAKKMKMKKNLTFISILLIFGINSFAQQIPNGSFETWSSDEPDSWNSTNQNVVGFGTFTTVAKDVSGAQQGSASAKLTVVTKTIPFIGTSLTLPGVLTLGTLNIDPINQTASVTGGFAFTGMPQKLTGYFKYQPINNDTCAMGWGLTKWNNGVQDIVGYAAINRMGTFNNWTYFEIPLEYRNWETPDTLNILFLNSNPLDGLDHTGSTMWIDNLSFVYGIVGIEGVTSARDIQIYAEPNARKLILTSGFVNQENLDIRLYNMAGVETNYWKRSMQKSTEHLDINNLPPGTYVIRISSGKRLIDTRKISILY